VHLAPSTDFSADVVDHQFSKPTKTTASSTGFRRETTEFAGKLSSGYLNSSGHIISRDDARLPDDNAAFEKARELSRGEYVIYLARVVGRIGKDGKVTKPQQ
jgi:hypothetical protein